MAPLTWGEGWGEVGRGAMVWIGGCGGGGASTGAVLLDVEAIDGEGLLRRCEGGKGGEEEEGHFFVRTVGPDLDKMRLAWKFELRR
jgi:hypothetical protein